MASASTVKTFAQNDRLLKADLIAFQIPTHGIPKFKQYFVCYFYHFLQFGFSILVPTVPCSISKDP